MLADYVMKSIDNLFSDKLGATISKQNTLSSLQPKATFTKETIQKSLHSIIRKEVTPEKRSPSPISKSRLKIILEHNRTGRIKSVVKRSVDKKETSPYQRIQLDQKPQRRHQIQPHADYPRNKQNDIISYYREERKSMDKSLNNEDKRSRIFTKSVQESLKNEIRRAR